jgi:tetratricopeptide (TPR) repeat protein
MERSQPARHHTILVVDVEGFGDLRRTNLHQVGVRDGLYRVVLKALEVTGVRWADCYHEDRGDAVFVLAPADVPKAVFVDSLPDAMVAALRVHNNTDVVEQRIRLRMALHAGEVNYDDHGVTSAALNLAFRLVDAAPLKDALANSPGVLALISSAWFFDDVVRHTPRASPATYRLVGVSEKETTTVGWIALPDHPYPPDASLRTISPAEYYAEPRPHVVPRQLPTAVRDFTGRADDMAALDALLPGDGDSPGVVAISAVDGTAGIGKTALAVYWAHRVQHRFPDGTLYADLRGYGPGAPATPAELLDGFLRALGAPAERMPVGTADQAGLYRSLLAGRRVLVVLDNASGADQVHPLLPGTAGCMVLVTSRNRLAGLVVTDAAHQLSLDLFTSQESLQLVEGIIGPGRAAAEPGAVAELIWLCARLPLALRIAAARATAYSHVTVADIVAELADDRYRLDALSRDGDENAAIRTVFDWSYQRLTAAQARLFRLLGLHPGPDLSVHAAAAISGLELREARRLLEALTAAHLIEPTVAGRYRFHDLLRAYAADQAGRYDSNNVRNHARESLLTWYAHTARACDKLVFPAHPQLPLRLVGTPRPAVIPGRLQALEWLIAEQATLFAALRQATVHDLYDHVVHTAESLRFLSMQGSWDKQIDASSTGLFAAQRSENRTAETFFRIWRSEVYVDTQQWDDALAEGNRALALARDLGDSFQQAWVLNNLGLLRCEQELFEDALEYLREAVLLGRGAGSVRLEAVVEGNIGRASAGLGRYRQALEHGERSLAMRRHIGDLSGEAYALCMVAQARQGLDQHEQAITLCQHAIAIGHEGIDRSVLAESLNTLAESLYHTGNIADAITCWRDAAALFDDHGEFDRATGIRSHLNTVQTIAPKP